MPNIDLKGLRIAVTGGTSGLGLALVEDSCRARRARRLRGAVGGGGEAGGAPNGRLRGRRRRRAQGGHRFDCARSDLESRRPRRADQQRLEPRADAARAARRHALRGFSPGARHQRARPLPPDQSPVRRPCVFRARGPRRRGGQHFERRRGRRLSRLGRLWRVQGRAPPHDIDLGRGGEGRGGEVPVARPRRHGYPSARPGRPRRRSDRPEASRRRRKRDRSVTCRRASTARPLALRP